jgi:predicted DNA-binding protein (MmcQ/YjbR family)
MERPSQRQRETPLMMTYDEYNAFCATLPAATHVVQWRGAHVWKVGAKVFAFGGWTKSDAPFITFKCSSIAFEMLQQEPGLRPAPYLAPRGGKWIQMHGEPGLSNEDMQLYLAASHKLVVQKLTKKLRAELKLEDL